MDGITNFWNVITKHYIEIPIIQRDYAHGRSSGKVVEIRNKIINDIYNSLKNKTILEFDFVYGNIKEIDGLERFIPLDGQQRLTTLFILHWYLALKEKKFIELQILEKFTYETRTSSRDFCSAIVSNAKNLPEITESIIISKMLKNQPWFFLSWCKDPTIKSMLQMLDDIHEKFNNIEYFWDILTDNDKCPIVFRFIELEHFGLEDDLYIKMNARGKALTEFENFKAKFEHYLKANYSKETSYFSHNIDGKWTDLFWSPPQNANFDNKYLNFFKVVAFNNYALKMDTSALKRSERISSIISNISNLLLQFDENGIRDLKILDYLVNSNGKMHSELNCNRLDVNELFDKIISDYLTYQDRILFYAFSRFLTESSPQAIDITALSNWMRIFYNLTTNTEYDQEIEYARSIKSIDIIIKSKKPILDYFSDNNNSVTGFNTIQIEEERIKSILILKSQEWANLIYEMENHKYYKGQIGFLFYFSGIQTYYKLNSNLNWKDDENANFKNKFIEYANKFKVIFNDKGLNLPFFLWERALLCKGFYPIGRNKKFSLLKNIDRDYSWKRLLRDSDNNEKREYIRDVLDNINENSIKEDLENIINTHNIIDDRKYFINEPRIIEACGSRFIQSYSDTYLLLKTSITAGYHKELKSYALYLKLNSFCKNNYYSDNKGIDSEKGITKINGEDVCIYWHNGKFEVTRNSKSISISEDDIIDYLKLEKII